MMADKNNFKILTLLALIGVAACYLYTNYYHNYIFGISRGFFDRGETSATFLGLVVVQYYFALKLSYITGFYVLLTTSIVYWEKNSLPKRIVTISFLTIGSFAIFYIISCVFITRPDYARVFDVFESGLKYYKPATARLVGATLANLACLCWLRRLPFILFCTFSIGVYLFMDILVSACLILL
jgi:hypothetical protein